MIFRNQLMGMASICSKFPDFIIPILDPDGAWLEADCNGCVDLVGTLSGGG